MAHFAELDENNIALRVIVVDDAHEADGENWCNEFAGGTWKQTSYNTFRNAHSGEKSPLRKNYAGISFHYDTSLDGFIPPQPYPSWLLDKEVCQWESPVLMPTDGEEYRWNEATLSWDEVGV